MENDPRWPALQRFVRGGFWRNFKVKYPEADEMYCRMMMVSRRLQAGDRRRRIGRAGRAGPHASFIAASAIAATGTGPSAASICRTCATPSISTLIAADNLLDRAAGRPETWVEATADDFNFDARQEVRLANDQLMALIAPSRGGQIYELDVRRILPQPAGHAHPPARGLSPQGAGRRQPADGNVRQHPRPRGLQAGRARPADPVRHLSAQEPGRSVLRQRRDARRRGLRARRRSGAISSQAAYEARVRRNPDRIQVQLSPRRQRLGRAAADHQGPDARRRQRRRWRSPTCWRTCRPDRPLHFAVEINFAGLPAGADDRYFYDVDGNRLGQLGTQLDLSETPGPGPGRRVAGHRRGPEDLAAHELLDLPRRDGQPVGGRLRAGPSVGGGPAALDRRRRRRRPLDRDHAVWRSTPAAPSSATRSGRQWPARPERALLHY